MLSSIWKWTHSVLQVVVKIFLYNTSIFGSPLSVSSSTLILSLFLYLYSFYVQHDSLTNKQGFLLFTLFLFVALPSAAEETEWKGVTSVITSTPFLFYFTDTCMSYTHRHTVFYNTHVLETYHPSWEKSQITVLSASTLILRQSLWLWFIHPSSGKFM